MIGANVGFSFAIFPPRICATLIADRCCRYLLLQFANPWIKVQDPSATEQLTEAATVSDVKPCRWIGQ
jgi:hypothetical protein